MVVSTPQSRKGKQLFAKLFIAVILSQAFLHPWNGQPSSSLVSSKYVSDMNPGMILRLQQPTINSFKKAMEEFLPHFINFDLKMPEKYHYEFGLFFNLLQWKIDWKDIKYSNVDLDIADVKIDLVPNQDTPSMSVEFPAIKHWEIDADQTVNFWFLPDQSKVQLIFKDFKFDFRAVFELDEHGYLDPIVQKVDITFGESYLYHDNPITAFMMHQLIYLTIVTLENSVWFVGDYVFTNMMGPVMDGFLNHYMFPFEFPSMVRGQNSKDKFIFDFRNTQDPLIADGYMDIFLSGELLHDGKDCKIEADDLNFHSECIDGLPFLCQSASQLVISESAATCIANNVARSNIGHIFLDSKTVSDLWNDPNQEYTTTSLGKHFPMLLFKLGYNRLLTSDVHAKDIQVIFGNYDTDVIISYTVCFTLNVDVNNQPQDFPDFDEIRRDSKNVQKPPRFEEVLYDEVKMVTSAKVHAEDDIIFITLLKHKLFVDNELSPNKRHQPIRNGMNLNGNEYREFLSSFGFFQNYLKKWFNNVYFKEGIAFPYNPQELYTTLEFEERQMHVMIEVEDDFAEFMEDEFWDEDAKSHRQEIIDQLKQK